MLDAAALALSQCVWLVWLWRTTPLTGHGRRTLSSLHVAHAHSWAWLASRLERLLLKVVRVGRETPETLAGVLGRSSMVQAVG
jgi:hypothetical protein